MTTPELANPIAMTLKLKYRTGKSGKRMKSQGGNSGKSHRNKLNDAAKRNLTPQPRKVMVLANGRTRMVLAEDI